MSQPDAVRGREQLPAVGPGPPANIDDERGGRLLRVAVGLIVRNAGIRFGAGSDTRWTSAAACLVFLAEALSARPEERPPAGSTAHHARSPT